MESEAEDSPIRPARQRSRTPIYFLSIGGPNFVEKTDHPAFLKLQEIGHEISTVIRPRALIVFSAHWQEHPNEIAVNVHANTDLIYDFFGFPRHYYEIEYPYKGSPEIAKQVIDELKVAGIRTREVKRGLDHGVWVGLLAAFHPEQNPLNIPIVQVSLFDDDDLEKHVRLGRALSRLREHNILIIGAGMAVHNLGDFRAMRAIDQTRNMPYATTFDEALGEAVMSPPEHRIAALLDLAKRDDFRRAHPTVEHLLPIYVAAGAAGSDVGEKVWTMVEGSLNWAQYRFGHVPENSPI